jgi:outer membrane protein OmpA-like peptidoglycan-associated protein
MAQKKFSSLRFSRDVPVSRLGPVASSGSGLTTSTSVSSSSLSRVETLRSELGATETERGTLVSLPGDVLFDFDKATIRSDARGTLDKLAELIKAGGGRVAIEGHSDSRGDDAYNKRLSEARATAVRDYLISVRTVDGTRLDVKGLGELRPVAPNAKPDGTDDPDGRQRNRRVEVIIGRN